jgi:hypothetical protein
MKGGRLIPVALLLSACYSAGTPIDHVSIAEVDLAVPTGWVRADNAREPSRAEWRPLENPGKESLTVTRSRPVEALAKAGPSVVEGLLRDAQQALPNASFGAPAQFVTSNGLAGVKVEGVFHPAGQEQDYRRVHAVVVDRTSLIHVVYTAVDASSEPMAIALEYLRSRKDG